MITLRTLASRMTNNEDHSLAYFVRKVVATIVVTAILLVSLNSAHIQNVNENSSTGMKGTIVIKESTNATDATPGAPPPTTTTTTPIVATEAPAPAASRYTYQLRGQPITEEERQEIVNRWGSWTLTARRPGPTGLDDFYAKYPNRDVPRADFPPTAWQRDKNYLDQFFPQALAMVQRAQEAILAEYGHGPTSTSNDNGSTPTNDDDFEERSTMFHVEIMETWENQNLNGKRASAYQGGFTTQTSWEGLVRRILHAIMTEDTFVFAMGGHSAAAGHGNHFTQSYTSQVQWILEAVFARLGVRHEARNFGMGGLGTLHNGMAATYIYGPDVDILMWDSGMTENDAPSQDLFHRQYILGGGKVPVLWSWALGTIIKLHLEAGADVGYPGEGTHGLPLATTIADLETIPWAARYLNCDSSLKDICRQNEYNGTCWLERDDYTPTTPQKSAPGGRASWHPGNRRHQIRGRAVAFTILSALKEALTIWSKADGYELPDDAWHMTQRYESVRAKVTASVGDCHERMKSQQLEFVCKYPVKARTEFTPRAFPPLTTIRTLLPPEQRTELGPPPPNAFDPPDVFNPYLHPPKGEIDVLNILEQGVPFESVLVPDYTSIYKVPQFTKPSTLTLGKGLGLETKSGDLFCDGSVTSFCSRGEGDCMLYGHNDGRNGIGFDGYSGWVVMNLPDVKHGYVAVKYHSWHLPDGLYKTEGWTSINNERRLGSIRSNQNSTLQQHSRRRVKWTPPGFCDEFRFEYAIDGTVTSLNYTEWEARSHLVQRVVEVLVLLEDPNYTGGKEQEVEVAVRITGCARTKHFALTHVYWS